MLNGLSTILGLIVLFFGMAYLMYTGNAETLITYITNLYGMLELWWGPEIPPPTGNF